MIQTILALLSLAVSILGIFMSRARTKKLEDRETAIEAREARLERAVGLTGESE
jgi:hypothetical protein